MDSTNRPQAFPTGALRRASLDGDPLQQFGWWFEEAVQAGEPDPRAATLATIGARGDPSARIISLKDVDARGLRFTSRYDSAKAREIAADPRVTLVFYWPSQGRQVRIMGHAQVLPENESAAYFEARSHPAQLALHVLSQGQPIGDRAVLDRHVARLAQAYPQHVPMPTWGGYLIVPQRAEFWQGQTNRLHDRFRYTRAENGTWTVHRLAP